jgi:hypothetical protein
MSLMRAPVVVRAIVGVLAGASGGSGQPRPPTRSPGWSTDELCGMAKGEAGRFKPRQHE